jgi:hypothetical protein
MELTHNSELIDRLYSTQRAFKTFLSPDMPPPFRVVSLRARPLRVRVLRTPCRSSH